MRVRHVILDRDGVLNREAADAGYVRNASEFDWLPGALEGLAALHASGVRISVASNQSGIGRGLMTTAQLESIHERMTSEALQGGARVDAIFVCPHAPEARCGCRKPANGLIDAAMAQTGIGPAETVVVGDDRRDLEAAWRQGVAAALVRTGKGRRTELGLREGGVPIFEDLAEFARAVATQSFSTGEQSMLTIHRVFAQHAQVMSHAAETLPDVLDRIAARCAEALARGNKILACGNGGSAADAQHLVAELVGRFRDERRALPAMTLMADSATLTALANDYGYAHVFARQVEGLARAGDVLFAISTSGNSANVVEAARVARARACTVVAMTGAHGGRLLEHADLLVRAPSLVVARIQEVHALSIHAIAEALDALILAEARP